MTDSDFFTESDADDLVHRGDRRAQIIDGQLFGSSLQGADVPPIPQRMEDSCMESSGIFTDADTRADDDTKNEPTDLSPDTETQSSNKTTCSQRKNTGATVNIVATTGCANRYNLDEKKRAVDAAHTATSSSSSPPYSRTPSSSNEENELSTTVVGKSLKAIDNVRQCDASTKARNNNVNTLNKSASVSAKKSETLTRKLNARRHDMTPQSALAEKRCKIRKTDDDSERTKSVHRKPPNPNKWDAVMNKIAENKSNQAVKKKNFSDVKSKVFSGLKSTVATTPPYSSAASNASVVSSSSAISSSAIKRQLFSSTTKR